MATAADSEPSPPSWEESALQQLTVRDNDDTAAPAEEEEWHPAMGTAKAEARERPAGTPKLLRRTPSSSSSAAPEPTAAPPVLPATKSDVDRERDYAAARARIFGQAESVARSGNWAQQALAAAARPEPNVVVAKGPSQDGSTGFEVKRKIPEQQKKAQHKGRGTEKLDPDFCRDYQPRPPYPAYPRFQPVPYYDGYYYEHPVYPPAPQFGPPVPYYYPPPTAPLPPGPPPPFRGVRPVLAQQPPLPQQLPQQTQRSQYAVTVQQRPPRAFAGGSPATGSSGRSDASRRHKGPASSTNHHAPASPPTNHSRNNHRARPRRGDVAARPQQQPPQPQQHQRTYEEEFPSLGA